MCEKFTICSASARCYWFTLMEARFCHISRTLPTDADGTCPTDTSAAMLVAAAAATDAVVAVVVASLVPATLVVAGGH